MVLTECVFEVSEYKVVRAVKSWTERSIWVQKAYNSAPMPKDQVHLIMQHTDPFCLTIEQFDELTFFNQPERSIFNRYTVDLVCDRCTADESMYTSLLLRGHCGDGTQRVCTVCHSQTLVCSSGRRCPRMMVLASIHQRDALTAVASLKSLLGHPTQGGLITGTAGQVLVVHAPRFTTHCLWRHDLHVPITYIRHIHNAGAASAPHLRGQVCCTRTSSGGIFHLLRFELMSLSYSRNECNMLSKLCDSRPGSSAPRSPADIRS